MQRITLYLKPKGQEKFNTNMASLFHGFMMEILNPDYADYLHQNNLKPYSQYIQKEEGKEEWQWVINTLNEEAFLNIAQPLLKEDTERVELTKKDLVFDIVKKSIDEKVGFDELARRFYLQEDARRTLNIHFLTPCSFKSGGEYMIFPDMKLIYQSLINKFDCFSNSISVKNEEALMHLCQHTRITDYRLRSCRFHIEGIRIPAFCGEIRIAIDGPETLVNLANMLLYFGIWSGIGIKTSLGMGAIKIE